MAANEEIRAKDILPHKTSFGDGDGFYGDGDISFFMEADKLLELIAQKVLSSGLSQNFEIRTSENAYKPGDFVVYEGFLYKFDVEHYGAWNNADAHVFDICAFLNSFLIKGIGNGFDNPVSNRAISATTGSVVPTSQGIDYYKVTSYIAVTPGQLIHYEIGINEGHVAAIAGYSDNTGSDAVILLQSNTSANREGSFKVPSGVNYIVACNNYNLVAAPVLDAKSYSENIENFDLSIAELGLLTAFINNSLFVDTDNKFDNPIGHRAISATTGSVVPTASSIDYYKVTPYMRVTPGQIIHYKVGIDSNNTVAAIAGYSDDTGSNAVILLQSNTSVTREGSFRVPSGVNYIVACNNYNLVAEPILDAKSFSTILSDLVLNESILGPIVDVLNKVVMVGTDNNFDSPISNRAISATTGSVVHTSQGIDYYKVTSYIAVTPGQLIHYKIGINAGNVAAIAGYSDNVGGNSSVLLYSTESNREGFIKIPSGVNYIVACNNYNLVAEPILDVQSYADVIIDMDGRLVNVEKAIPAEKTIITVKKDGTGDYTSVVDAIQSISSASKLHPFEIRLYPGEYDMISEFFGESDFTDSNSGGPTLPDYVDLIGVGHREDIIVKAIFPSTIKYRTSMRFSPMNAFGNNKIANITFIAFNCRYAFHDQVRNTVDIDRVRVVSNCVFIHNGFDEGATPLDTQTVTEENNTTTNRWRVTYAYGQGTCQGSKTLFEYCDFICNSITAGALFTHDYSTAILGGATLDIKDCNFSVINSANLEEAIYLHSIDDLHDTPITLVGCKVRCNNASNSIEFHATQNGEGYYLYGHGNDIQPSGVNIPSAYADKVRLIS